MELLTIDELRNVINVKRGEIMKSDEALKELAPILRPSDVVHNRAPEPLSNELPRGWVMWRYVCISRQGQRA